MANIAELQSRYTRPARGLFGEVRVIPAAKRKDDGIFLVAKVPTGLTDSAAWIQEIDGKLELPTCPFAAVSRDIKGAYVVYRIRISDHLLARNGL